MQHNKHTNCLINKLLQMKQLILLTTVFFIFLSCKKAYEPFEITCTLTQDSSLAKKYIKGTWEWVETKKDDNSKRGYSFLTPKTEGYSLKMILGDSTVQLFKNSSLEDNFKYKIQLWGEVRGGFQNLNDYRASFVLYNQSGGIRYSATPIFICPEILKEISLNTSNLYDRVWRKL
jgi:hypothetical protein